MITLGRPVIKGHVGSLNSVVGYILVGLRVGYLEIHDARGIDGPHAIITMS